MKEDLWSPRDPAFKRVRDEAKAAIKRIEQSTCVPHKFVFSPTGFKGKYVCDLCGGVIDSVQYKWYLIGLAHGRGDPTPKTKVK